MHFILAMNVRNNYDVEFTEKYFSAVVRRFLTLCVRDRIIEFEYMLWLIIVCVSTDEIRLINAKTVAFINYCLSHQLPFNWTQGILVTQCTCHITVKHLLTNSNPNPNTNTSTKSKLSKRPTHHSFFGVTFTFVG